jgi:general secretion pathway protein H
LVRPGGGFRWPLGRRFAASVPRGERAALVRPGGGAVGVRGFTLIELLVVLAIVAIGSALVVVSLRDSAQSRLDEEAERLGALLESARTEARASGITVRWEPAGAEATDGAHFRFFGLPASARMPTHWLREGVSAEIVGARAVLLGPEPILPPQRIVLKRDERSVVLASDGLAPFARAAPVATP